MENQLKIVIDSAIPFIKDVFEPHASVSYVDSKSIDADIVRDANALIIRTRTKCNRELLHNSQVKHIATATIGFDHIDLDYCREQGIKVTTAAGCNARGVLQWMGATLVYLSRKQGWDPTERTLGVVGVGNVGSLVERYAKLWGFKVLSCDPPRHLREGGDFVSLEQICAQADIITFHTPLNAQTHHMVDSKVLASTKTSSIIINASRGEVVDTQALKESGHEFVLDVWENEPNIDLEVLDKAILATTHIAGYSVQGKANATTMAVRQVSESLKLPLEMWQSDAPRVEPRDISWEELLESTPASYDIEQESLYLKSHPRDFEQLRNSYSYREEFF